MENLKTILFCFDEFVTFGHDVITVQYTLYMETSNSDDEESDESAPQGRTTGDSALGLVQPDTWLVSFDKMA